MRNTLKARDRADRFIERGETRLRYRDEGSGPAVVFVHGWALDLDMWQPQAEVLGGQFRAVRMDRRSFGESGGTASISEDARDLLHLLEHLQIERAAIVGMSQGARVALMLANTAPSRVAALVLDGAPALEGMLEDGREEELPMANFQRILRDEGVAALRRELATHPFLQVRTQDEGTRRLLLQMLDRYRGSDLQTLKRAPVSAVNLEALSLPVLVLNGAHDTAHRREVGDALASRLPRSERVLISASGHLPNLDNPTAYNRFLREFLERNFHR